MKKEHKLYLAGPFCFYPEGETLVAGYRKEAEFHGFTVTMPNDNVLVQEGETVTRKELGSRIYNNCLWGLDNVDGILINLETYRGSEPDGGSIYELGMAYGQGARCYGYTRDKRSVGLKYQSAKYDENAKTAHDSNGQILGHHELPFSVDVVGSTKIIEGTFHDCLNIYMTDLEEESKLKAHPLQLKEEPLRDLSIHKDRPIVYVSTSDRDNEPDYEEMRALLDSYGYDAYFPTDEVEGVTDIETDDIYTKAYNIFDRYSQHVRNCDIILLDLNDFRGGYEPNSDVAFEAGYACSLGKRSYGYMTDTRKMTERIPNTPTDVDTRDFNGMNVENFDGPLNLMFASSMEIFEGSLKEAIKKMAEKEKK